MPRNHGYPESPEKRKKFRKANYDQTRVRIPPRPYAEEEDALILAHSIPDRELSGQIQRSVQSIQIRRSRLKLHGGRNA